MNREDIILDYFVEQEKENGWSMAFDLTAEHFGLDDDYLSFLTSRSNLESPKSTVYTVEVEVSQNWIDDGFDLTAKWHQEELKEAVLEKMLGYAQDHEVKVSTVKSTHTYPTK